MKKISKITGTKKKHPQLNEMIFGKSPRRTYTSIYEIRKRKSHKLSHRISIRMQWFLNDDASITIYNSNNPRYERSVERERERETGGREGEREEGGEKEKEEEKGEEKEKGKENVGEMLSRRSSNYSLSFGG